MSFDDPGDTRYHADDGCPLFSERLEDHIVGVSKGHIPNRGRFCGNCFTPLGRDSLRCPHCGELTDGSGRGALPVTSVPQPIMDALIAQRKTESTWVTSFAYLGVLIAVVSGLAIVLSIPFFHASLLWATIFYGPWLLIGSRVFAGILGGYYGDRIGYEKARARTREAWDEWLAERPA